MSCYHEPASAGNALGLPIVPHRVASFEPIDPAFFPAAAVIQRRTRRPASTCRLLAQVAGFRTVES